MLGRVFYDIDNLAEIGITYSKQNLILLMDEILKMELNEEFSTFKPIEASVAFHIGTSHLFCWMVSIRNAAIGRNGPTYFIKMFYLTHFMPLVYFYTLETLESLWFSEYFRRYRKRPVTWNDQFQCVSVFLSKSQQY